MIEITEIERFGKEELRLFGRVVRKDSRFLFIGLSFALAYSFSVYLLTLALIGMI